MSEEKQLGGKKKKGLFSLLQGLVKPKETEEQAEILQQEQPVAQEQEPPQEAEPQLNTKFPAAESTLYQAYCRMQGLPPLEENAQYDAGVFHMEGLAPSEETLELLKNLDRNAALVLERWTEKEGDPVDAEPMILVSADKMRVFLFAFPPQFDGNDIQIEQLRSLLEEKKIVYGTKETFLDKFCQGKHYMQLYLIASGTFPLDGKDGSVMDHYSRQWEMHLTVKPDNTIDYRDLGWLQTIREGEVLCDIVPPTPATSGFDVFGKELKGKDGKKATAPSGNNTALNAEGTALVAKIDGVVTCQAEKFRVDPLLIVEGSVDTAVGNLDVVGDVLVKGDVKEGFTVKATGNITVEGGVEAAFLTAGGNVQVGLGMNGNSAGSIHAKENVYSKFFENTKVWAGGSIICDTIINSDIASEGEVLVTTGRGVIIGGSITALLRIAATTIGNPSNRAIEIILGNSSAYLAERKEIEEARVQEATEIQELTKDLKFMERQLNTQIKRDKISEINLQLKMRQLKFSKLDKEYQKLLEREADIGKCRLKAEVLYPPATISVGSVVKNINENTYNVLIYYKNGEINVANV